MISDGGHYVDGSWLLSVRIDYLNVDRHMRVKGDWSIGRVLVGLTERLSHPPKLACEPNDISLCPGLVNSGWSDFALWWPAKNRWILQTHASLDQYGLQADARLHFIRIHGRLKIQLPDLQYRVFCDVNFTEPVFRVVVQICKYLGILHPEELSLQYGDFEQFFNSKSPTIWSEQWSTLPTTARKSMKKPAVTATSKQDLRQQKRPTSFVLSTVDQTHRQPATLIHNGTNGNNENQTMPRRTQVYGPPRVRNRPISGNVCLASARPESIFLSQTLYGAGMSKVDLCEDPTLISSPQISLVDALSSRSVVRNRGFFTRAKYSAMWLDLGRSLMEQGIYQTTLNLDAESLDSEVHCEDGYEGKENGLNGSTGADGSLPVLRLRFKYNNFYELTRKQNAVRINQIFEQARWSIVSEAVECTNEEAALFAAILLRLHQLTGASEVRSFSLSGEMAGVDGQSRSISPPLSQPPSQRRASSTFAIDDTFRLSTLTPRPASPQDLDSEIDQMLEDLASTCLQTTPASTLARSGTAGKGGAVMSATVPRHHFPRRFSTPYRPRWERSGIATEKQAQRSPLDVSLPELAAYLKVCKPRSFGLKTYRRFYVVLRKTSLLLFKSQEDYQNHQPAGESICLLGSEAWPDISPTTDRYALRVFTPLMKQALPLSSALLANNSSLDLTETNASLATRLRRRASLLSLTSLGGLNTLCGRAVSRASGLLNEVILRMPDEAHYVDWASAIRLAGSLSLGCAGAATPETLRRLYEAEKKATTSLLQLLTPLPLKVMSLKTDGGLSGPDRVWLQKNFSVVLPYRLGGEHSGLSSGTLEPNASSSSALLANKEEANERLVRHIVDIHSRLSEMSVQELKLSFIGHWQQLTGNGVVYFVARFQTSVPVASALGLPADTPEQALRALAGHSVHVHPTSRQVTISASRRDEVLGIGNGRVARHDPSTGEIHAAWRLEMIQGWNVNRELNELVLMLAPTPSFATATANEASSPDGITTPTLGTPKASTFNRSPHKLPSVSASGRVVIRPVGVSVQKVSEVLGVNAFLSLRSPTKSQEMDESLFYRLIGASPNKSLYPSSIGNGAQHTL